VRVTASKLRVAAAASMALAAAHPLDARGSTADAYRGLAAWVDVFDPGPWNRPERSIAKLARKGVTTVFVQTSNYRLAQPVHRPRALSRLLSAAERRDVDVIAWYLPGFEDPRRDWRRVRAAVSHESGSGHRFDGFALDIEATAVRSIAVRNRRMLRLSSRLRELVGDTSHSVPTVTSSPPGINGGERKRRLKGATMAHRSFKGTSAAARMSSGNSTDDSNSGRRRRRRRRRRRNRSRSSNS
jgi:hypothetical protein